MTRRYLPYANLYVFYPKYISTIVYYASKNYIHSTLPAYRTRHANTKNRIGNDANEYMARQHL